MNSPNSATSTSPKPLSHYRLIVPAILLAALVLTKLAPMYLEFAPSVFAASVFGPMYASMGILAWWLLISGAPGRQRLAGTFAIVVMVVSAYLLSHKSMQSMFFMFYQLPLGMGLFTATLLVLSLLRVPWRFSGALLAGAIGFFCWTLVRHEGTTGSFAVQRFWRWEPTTEERYLTELAKQKKAQAPDATKASAADLPDTLGEVQWPGFRGEHRDGVVPGVKLAEDWKAHPPKVLWRRIVGPAWSSFAVAGKRLFTQEQHDQAEAVVCWNADTGENIWTNQVEDERFWESISGAGPRATPTLAGGKLYALGATGILQCLDPLTGKTLWMQDLRKDANRPEPPIWGFSSSPLVADGKVIVHAGGKGDKGVLAYDCQSGDLSWTAPSGDHSYSSPQLSRIAGQDRVLMLSNDGLEIIDPHTGKSAKNYEWKFENYRVLQPLVLGNSILAANSMSMGTRRIDIDGSGDQLSFTDRWTSRSMKSNYNDFAVHKGYLYGFDEKFFACVDVNTGEQKWKKRGYGNGQLLLLPEADQLLILCETPGDLALLRAAPEKGEELARIPLLADKTWNHFALVGKRLYVRNDREAAAVELPLAE